MPQWRLFRVEIDDPAAQAAREAETLAQVPAGVEWTPVDLQSVLNADVRTIYRQQYLSPRPDTVSARIGSDGYSPWTFPFWRIGPPEIGLDGVPKLLDEKGMLKTPQGVPFAWPGEAKNVAFTSLWDNWPTRVTVPVGRKADAAWFLICGSTNPMQCHIANAVIRLRYAGGQEDTLELVPPRNYWNLSPIGKGRSNEKLMDRTDYDYRADAFCLPKTPPTMVQLGENCRAMVTQPAFAPRGRPGKHHAGGSLSRGGCRVNGSKPNESYGTTIGHESDHHEQDDTSTRCLGSELCRRRHRARFAPAPSGSQPASAPSRPAVERKDGYFGIHFDLHPKKSDTALGRDVTEENIRAFLRRVRPDYVQYDCVGVPGYSGYPTRIGWPAPGIVKDSLAVWRKVTREKRVALLIHYCVLWNQAAVEHHPDWAAVNAQGVREKTVLSIFSPFAEQLLIPQLKEAATLYDLDGAWMDADAWVARLDYSPAALAEWKRQTGKDAAPKSRTEPDWAEWKMFHRREFEKYLCRYVDAIHAHSPKFQIACNWMYSLVSGVWPVGSKVDYLSGDYPKHSSTDEARAEARYFASNGKPWDLLAWGFNKHGLKSATQLKQEAAATIMQGGGWGIYYVPTRSGQISDAIIKTVGEVADFCRARQAVCFRSTSVPQVALLQSAETYWDQADNTTFGCFGARCREDTKGALFALLALHYSVDILAEHQLTPRLHEFPVVVIPDAYKLTDEFRRTLLDYVEAGGSLVLLGERSARLFEPELGVKFEGLPSQSGVIGVGPTSVLWTNGWQKIVPVNARPPCRAAAHGGRGFTRHTRRHDNVAREGTDRSGVWTGRGKIPSDKSSGDPRVDWHGHARGLPATAGRDGRAADSGPGVAPHARWEAERPLPQPGHRAARRDRIPGDGPLSRRRPVCCPVARAAEARRGPLGARRPEGRVVVARGHPHGHHPQRADSRRVGGGMTANWKGT